MTEAISFVFQPSDIEKQIYSKYETSREQILTAIRNELLSSHPIPLKDLPEDMASYMSYIYSYLSDSSVGIIQRDKIDPSSEAYQAWKEETISLREYIYSMITLQSQCARNTKFRDLVLSVGPASPRAFARRCRSVLSA